MQIVVKFVDKTENKKIFSGYIWILANELFSQFFDMFQGGFALIIIFDEKIQKSAILTRNTIQWRRKLILMKNFFANTPTN
jgi:hypothetical protein